jgi:nucleoid-associated protein YgaU
VSESSVATETEPDVTKSARDGPEGEESSDVSPPTSEAIAGGVWYWIRRGDTLWDISSNFYRNPWRYGQIAEENSIRNPDLIFAGSKIFIPEKQ